jgi:hypothetical protein
MEKKIKFLGKDFDPSYLRIGDGSGNYRRDERNWLASALCMHIGAPLYRSVLWRDLEVLWISCELINNLKNKKTCDQALIDHRWWEFSHGDFQFWRLFISLNILLYTYTDSSRHLIESDIEFLAWMAMTIILE